MSIDIEGVLVFISAMVLFFGSVYVLLAAVFGRTLGYLISATGFFAFLLILSSLWTFGAPGTPRYLGPKGALPAWVALAEGERLASTTYPAIEEYPAGPWTTAEEDSAFKGEVDGATQAFQTFLAEEAGVQLREEGLEGEISADAFVIRNLRFTDADGTVLAAATAFASQGGPQVTVVGYKDPGNEPVPSYAFLIVSLIGFGAHLPFLDRAEKKRKDILTGGDQPPFRGPA